MADISDGRIPQKLITEGIYQSESSQEKRNHSDMSNRRNLTGYKGDGRTEK